MHQGHLLCHRIRLGLSFVEQVYAHTNNNAFVQVLLHSFPTLQPSMSDMIDKVEAAALTSKKQLLVKHCLAVIAVIGSIPSMSCADNLLFISTHILVHLDYNTCTDGSHRHLDSNPLECVCILPRLTGWCLA